MKIVKLKMWSFLISLTVVSLLAGCVASTPGTVTTAPNPVAGLPPVTVTNPPTYAVSPQLVNTLSNIQAEAAQLGPVISTTIPPAAPFVPLAQMLLGIVATAITGVSSAVAYVKTKSAATHAAAADSLAETVVKAGVTAQATQIAAVNGTSAAVASHLAANAISAPSVKG